MWRTRLRSPLNSPDMFNCMNTNRDPTVIFCLKYILASGICIWGCRVDPEDIYIEEHIAGGAEWIPRILTLRILQPGMPTGSRGHLN